MRVGEGVPAFPASFRPVPAIFAAMERAPSRTRKCRHQEGRQFETMRSGIFSLPQDVSAPQGDLTQVCVVSEADMKPLNADRRGRC
jgi:hypothetical protein